VAAACALVAGLVVLRAQQDDREHARRDALAKGRALAASLAVVLENSGPQGLQAHVERVSRPAWDSAGVAEIVARDAGGSVIARSPGALLTGGGPRSPGEAVREAGPAGMRWRTTLRLGPAENPGTLELLVAETSGAGPGGTGLAAVGALLAAVALAYLVMASVLRSHVERPMKQLADAATAFRADEAVPALQADGTDELRSLAAAFGAMAERLRSDRTRLEREVEERTAELLHANEHLAVANAQLQEIAATDALTGLANRRAFTDRLEIETERVQRLGTPLSLIILDLDFFKRVNDTKGHPEGDRALASLATLLRDGRRGMDLVARYGGEEFAVLLPDTSHRDAMLVAERIRAAVEVAGLPGRCTVSAGVATMPEDASGAEGLVAAADLALYGAKAAGRNRVRGAGAAKQAGAAPQ